MKNVSKMRWKTIVENWNSADEAAVIIAATAAVFN